MKLIISVYNLLSERASIGLKRAASGGAAQPRGPSPAQGGATLESCLAAFFAPEIITWECPKEAAEVS